ncbi:hypothetical protein CEQ90_07200 [Lewinellaceae bacterium SD302]|nr:hypothetical protein CEQ90_07200 [Lewinellaceae bacterium SD302]
MKAELSISGIINYEPGFSSYNYSMTIGRIPGYFQSVDLPAKALLVWFNAAIFLFTIASPTITQAQSGFIQSYCFENESSLQFNDLILQNDTLVMYGRARHPMTGQIGIYFSKMDTLGNILIETTHYDSTGDDYFFDINADLIICSDGGYAIAGKTFFRGYSIIIKFNYDGFLDFVKEHPDDSVLHTTHWNLIETQSGYMTVGAKQQMSDGKWDAFVMRTDESGNKIWETSYGQQEVWEVFKEILSISENEFLVSGAAGLSTSQVQNPSQQWSQNRVLKIDSTGNISEVWEGEIKFYPTSVGMSKLYPTIDENWFSIGSNNMIIEGYDLPVNQVEVTKRNESFEAIETITILDHTSSKNILTDLTPGLNQEWVTVGRYLHEVPGPPTYYYDAGLIAKVNEAGDLLWTRTDTLFYDASGYSDHYLGGVVVLPSGSIIACGQVNSDIPAPGKSYGWLIKVDKDGCIEPGCNPTSSSSSLLDGTAFEVFPNPLSDQLNVSGPGRFDLELLDSNGRLLQSSNGNVDQASFNLRTYPTGNYYLRIKVGSRWAVRKVVKQ